MSHILIVEDESATAWAIAESLQDEGHETTRVETAEEAVAKLERVKFDLVLTDVRLPGMSGLSLTRHLRGQGMNMPVLVLTAYGAALVIEELGEGVVHEVFSKPFRMDQLRRSIRVALGGPEGRSSRAPVRAEQVERDI